MEIDVPVEVQPRVEKPAEGGDARLVEREALRGEEGVEAQARDIHHVQGKAGHVGVALDVIEVVHGIDSGEKLPQQLQPPRLPAVVAPGHLDEIGDVAGVDALAPGERA